ncbi:MAG: methyltransferase domain-containing protein [Thermodesulfobacteriota bacterium]
MTTGVTGLAGSFSRAAASYDTFASVQAATASQLLQALPAGLAPGRVLELGCATGSYTALLADRFPASDLYALDFSPAMLVQAAARLAHQPRVRLILADALDFLAAPAQSFDLITANATLHWLPDLPRCARLVAGRLRRRGVLAASLFGPRTFQELAAALEAVCGRPIPVAAQAFPTPAAVAACFAAALPGARVTERSWQETYPSTLHLMRHIKATGTRGGGPPPLILTRRLLADLDAWLLEHRGGCRVTIQLVLLEARR